MSHSKTPKRRARPKVYRLSRTRPTVLAASKYTRAEMETVAYIAAVVRSNPRLVGLVRDTIDATGRTSVIKFAIAFREILLEITKRIWGHGEPKNAPPKPSRRKSVTKVP